MTSLEFLKGTGKWSESQDSSWRKFEFPTVLVKMQTAVGTVITPQQYALLEVNAVEYFE